MSLPRMKMGSSTCATAVRKHLVTLRMCTLRTEIIVWYLCIACLACMVVHPVNSCTGMSILSSVFTKEIQLLNLLDFRLDVVIIE